MADDWYRCSEWTEESARRFFEKLRRARNKAQYLRIQASTLAKANPKVALELLDQYFSLHDDLDRAQAHVDRATALLALGRRAEALDCYEAALAREAEFPNVKTDAWLLFSFLIAAQGMKERYERALEVLDTRSGDAVFPVDHFRLHAAQAVIAADRGGLTTARQHAGKALDAAAREESGFRYHPNLGLISGEYKQLVRRLKRLT